MNLNKIDQYLSCLKLDDVEVLVLPEAFLTGFCVDDSSIAVKLNDTAFEHLCTVSKEKRLAIVGSAIISHEDKIYNRALWIENGQILYSYDKHHLFSLAKENDIISKGLKRLDFSFKSWKVRLAICYDLRFPEWLRNRNINGFPEYDLLIIHANWPAARATAWETLLRARAIENQAFVVGVNIIGKDGKGIEYSGKSMIIAPDGEVLQNAMNEEGIFHSNLDLNFLHAIRNKYPFIIDQD